MGILSLDFLILMTALVAVHYCLPVRFRWIGLLTASMVFYAGAGWHAIAYLGAVTLITWLGGLYMGRCRDKEKLALAQEDKATAYHTKKQRSYFLAFVVLLVMGGMAVMKYGHLLYGMIQSTYLAMTEGHKTLADWSLVAPLGLSYFTFQSVGYVVDCARGKADPESNPLKYLLFVSFFPQISQGPIMTYRQLMPQLLLPARFEPTVFVSGFQLAIWGCFKKLVIADRLAPVTSAIAIGFDMPGWIILLGVALYAVRLYADFSGGMDVIRGAARMLGIDLAENFRRPFFSMSVAEYWRRWHISLGVWFRSYLFYPLTTSRFGLSLSRGGQRIFGKKIGRTLPGVVATFIIFFLIGIWHTANWNAVVYGVYFGVLLSAALLLEPLFKKIRNRLRINIKAWWWKGFCILRTWGLILLAQYFAFTAGPKQGLSLLGATFQNWTFADAGATLTGLLEPLEWYIVLVALLLVLAVDLMIEFGADVNGKLAGGSFLVRWPVLIGLIVTVLVFGCYGAGFDAVAFLYTQF